MVEGYSFPKTNEFILRDKRLVFTLIYIAGPKSICKRAAELFNEECIFLGHSNKESQQTKS